MGPSLNIENPQTICKNRHTPKQDQKSKTTNKTDQKKQNLTKNIHINSYPYEHPITTLQPRNQKLK